MRVRRIVRVETMERFPVVWHPVTITVLVEAENIEGTAIVGPADDGAMVVDGNRHGILVGMIGYGREG